MPLVSRCHILRLKCTKFNFGWGSASDPADPLAGFKGPTSKRRERKVREGRRQEGREGNGKGDVGPAGARGAGTIPVGLGLGLVTQVRVGMVSVGMVIVGIVRVSQVALSV